MWVLAPHSKEPIMQTITTIGLDIAESVFQVHGVDAAGNVIVRRKMKRRYVSAFFQKLQPGRYRAPVQGSVTRVACTKEDCCGTD
jgi:transposase